jgi:hypothetical protein
MMQLLPAVLPTLCHTKHMGVSVTLLTMYEGYEYYSIHNVIENYELGLLPNQTDFLHFPILKENKIVHRAVH